MYEPLVDASAELASIVVYAVGTLALSAVGVVAEYNGVKQFLGGEQLLAAWFALMGAVALAFAWNLGREKLLPLLAERGRS